MSILIIFSSLSSFIIYYDCLTALRLVLVSLFSRNVVYGTGDNVLKSGNKFAYLGHAIYRAHQKLDSDWDEVNKQLMLVVYHLQSAAASFDELKA